MTKSLMATLLTLAMTAHAGDGMLQRVSAFIAAFDIGAAGNLSMTCKGFGNMVLSGLRLRIKQLCDDFDDEDTYPEDELRVLAGMLGVDLINFPKGNRRGQYTLTSCRCLTLPSSTSF